MLNEKGFQYKELNNRMDIKDQGLHMRLGCVHSVSSIKGNKVFAIESSLDQKPVSTVFERPIFHKHNSKRKMFQLCYSLS